ncbi:MAG: 16S rRNA (guanine(527)-N(7))-methyltransferase RsmG [Dehalococcoidia bacterium]|nr:16S rRNA (guanine(527)-N(7))-methyltransferase RsmG [Dehalococcoidia bacterium]MDH4299863.1 16S rRNA (guanine(527)-N(7))-methyltransferase RsmG [Dehalococcoidia bacterium]MDH4367558.1 16S rRNA (guanine(527)-N(7))-methyltransferase RsmG [Dehalococcoidia bacterium]
MERLIEGAGKLGMKLTTGQVKQFELYYQELVEWNKKMNLTAITDYSSVQVKHFLDSLTVTLALPEEVTSPDFNIVDIGTGAGFPSVPLKILFPEPGLVLLEPTRKKTAFLHHIIGKLALKNVEVLNSRAEEAAHLPAYREQFALVLSRAVALLPTLVELALPFCRIGGTFIAQKKGEIGEEVTRAKEAIAVLGGALRQTRKVESDEFADARYLVIIDKIHSTPGKYPRRPGVPKRRPI